MAVLVIIQKNLENCYINDCAQKIIIVFVPWNYSKFSDINEINGLFNMK